jgi:hypothetical protein
MIIKFWQQHCNVFKPYTLAGIEPGLSLLEADATTTMPPGLEKVSDTKMENSIQTASKKFSTLRLKNRRSSVRIPPGCKVFSNIYIMYIAVNMNLICIVIVCT